MINGFARPLEDDVGSRLARVRSVTTLGERRVRLAFTDGTVRDVDLAPLLWGPVFERIRNDDEAFAEVSVDEELGTIVWPNGADVDPDVLHGDAPPLQCPAHAVR